MHLRNLLVMLPLSLAACGGSAKKATNASAAASECAVVGQNMARIFAAEAPQAPLTMAAEVCGALDRRCIADAWPAEARACLGKAANNDALDACDPLLTQAQKDAASADIGKVIGNAMGGSMYGGAMYGGAGYGNPCGGAANPCGM